ncbi:MAG: hypothetical protein ACRDHO_03260 [Actinomycetota bacterium]
MPRSRSREPRWLGEATYRVLSYYFSVRWEWAPAGERIDRVLGSFGVSPDPKEERSPPLPGVPPRYSLLRPRQRGDGRYWLLCSEAKLIGSRDAEDVLAYFSWHVSSEAFRRTGDFLLIHAGAVAAPTGAGVLLPGASGSGKTSLVAGLVRAGYSYLSDEAGVIDPVTRRLYPFPRALSLKAGSFMYFPELEGSGDDFLPSRAEWHVRPEELAQGHVPGEPCEIKFVVAPRYQPEAPTSLTPVTRAEGVMELATNAINLSLYGGRALHVLEGLVSRARCFRLVSGDLPSSVQALTELTEGPRRPRRRGQQPAGHSQRRANYGASGDGP